MHLRRQFRAVSRRAGKGTHRVYIRAQSTHQKLCSAAQGQRAEYLCLLSRAWTFAVEAGVSRGSAEEEMKGLLIPHPLWNFRTFSNGIRGEETEEAPDEKKSKA